MLIGNTGARNIRRNQDSNPGHEIADPYWYCFDQNFEKKHRLITNVIKMQTILPTETITLLNIFV